MYRAIKIKRKVKIISILSDYIKQFKNIQIIFDYLREKNYTYWLNSFIKHIYEINIELVGEN